MTISVAMCTYNGEKFLKEQIDSILNQTQEVNEIIICDDVSTDATVGILKGYEQLYPNIFKIYYNNKNIRSNKNFEKAIKLCSGDLVFLADQDDVWATNKVKDTKLFFKENPSVEGVFSNANLIDEDGNSFTNKSLWDNTVYDESILKNNSDIQKYITFAHSIVTGATFCFKKISKEFIFPFPDREVFLHDEWISLLLSKRNTLASNPKKLISYRVHRLQQVGLNKSSTLFKKTFIVNYIFKTRTQFSFIELLKIRKNFVRVVNKYQKLKDSYFEKINFDINEIIKNNTDAVITIEKELKKSNLILYILSTTIANKIKKKQ